MISLVQYAHYRNMFLLTTLLIATPQALLAQFAPAPRKSSQEADVVRLATAFGNGVEVFYSPRQEIAEDIFGAIIAEVNDTPDVADDRLIALLTKSLAYRAQLRFNRGDNDGVTSDIVRLSYLQRPVQFDTALVSPKLTAATSMTLGALTVRLLLQDVRPRDTQVWVDGARVNPAFTWVEVTPTVHRVLLQFGDVRLARSVTTTSDPVLVEANLNPAPTLFQPPEQSTTDRESDRLGTLPVSENELMADRLSVKVRRIMRSGSEELQTSQAFPLNGGQGTMAVTYETRARIVHGYDVGVMLRVWKSLGVGLSASRTSSNYSGSVTLDVPDMRTPSRTVRLGGTVQDLQRIEEELAFEIAALGRTPRVESSLFIGPTLNRATHTMVSRARLSQIASTVSLSGFDVERRKAFNMGIVVGLGVTWVLAGPFGVDFDLRYTAGADDDWASLADTSRIGGGCRFAVGLRAGF